MAENVHAYKNTDNNIVDNHNIYMEIDRLTQIVMNTDSIYDYNCVAIKKTVNIIYTHTKYLENIPKQPTSCVIYSFTCVVVVSILIICSPV